MMFIAGALGINALTGSITDAANTNANVSNETFDRITTKDVLGHYILNEDVAVVLGRIKIPQEDDIVIEMHKMANNYIIADEIRGTQEMTQERINALLVALLSVESNIVNNQYSHKTHLIDILTIWKQGEFFMLANDHNYLWDALGGQIGRATGVKDKKDLPAWSI